MASTLPAVVFALATALLLAVDVWSWRRTAPVRTGASPSRPTGGDGPAVEVSILRPRAVRSPAWATSLAALAGLAILSWGVTAALSGRYPTSAVGVAAGAFILVAGIRSRVIGLDVEPAGLRVRYAARRAIFHSWSSVRVVRPPRTPLSAWRVDSPYGDLTLMPSDLLGHEGLLETVVTLAGLTFDGRSWSRGHPP